MIRLLEELSLNAWPSTQTLCFDGWLLRFNDGYTRRANSVNPLYTSLSDVLEKVNQCEEVYATKGEDCIFKITPESCPDSLDTVLEEMGYAKEAPTSVQVVNLETVDELSPDYGLLIETQATPDWVSDFKALSNLNRRHVPAMIRLLDNIAMPKGFFALRRNAQTAATGLAVLERGYLGLFDIATDPKIRNQGTGTEITRQMLQWGRAKGAKYAYLQVMHDNAAALHIYSKLGFREVYSYWYRVKQLRIAED